MFRRDYTFTINEDRLPTLKAVFEIVNVEWYVSVRMDDGTVRVHCKGTKKEIDTVIEKLNRYGVKANMKFNKICA